MADSLDRWWCDWTIPLDIWKLLVRTQPNIARTGIALALDPELEPLYLDFVEELDASQLPRLHFLDLDTNSVESMLVWEQDPGEVRHQEPRRQWLDMVRSAATPTRC